MKTDRRAASAESRTYLLEQRVTTLEASGGGGALVHVETLNPTAVSSINSEAWVGAGYRVIEIHFDLLVTADGSTLYGLLKLNGAYKSGTANYRSGNGSDSSSGAGTSTAGSVSSSGLVIGGSGATWGIGNQPTEGIAGTIRLLQPETTGRPKRVTYSTIHGAPSGQHVANHGGGTWDGPDYSTALQGLQLAMSSGTMTGVIEVYGIV